MKCSQCQSDDIISCSELNSFVCSKCGFVISENFLVNENTFSEKVKVGYQYSSILSCTSQNLTSITRIFSQIINQLNLPQNFMEIGKRYYKCSVNKGFTRGRSLLKIACVILYTLCRINKTKHLLIDFSEVSKVNLYQLGITYLHFIKVFQLNIPVIDPSLFLKRFCSKLNINNVDEIAHTSIKIVQCMKSQWITEGRNPSGICGAAMYIGLKCNGYNAKLNEISCIVRVTEQIIKKRIEEFESTSYSKLTKKEFDEGRFASINIMDPPSYILNREKDKEKSIEIDNHKDKETLSIISKCEDKGEIATKASSFGSINLYEESLGRRPQVIDEEDISELNEEDCDNYIHSNKEYDMRKVLWEEKNKEWLKEQQEKKAICPKSKNKKDHLSQSIKTSKRLNKVNTEYKTPGEAIMKTEAFKRMGLSKSYINNLFQ